ncbi:lycopene cyclase family protein [Aurantibacter aestuarii]|uniref:Lycopene cyclase n=1 Tax=Aurantibacter aestuarii TaxID=1266046 RepID=A0A2T1N826_9FLAO|nr:lycopene cyclase family protein [Aurantibacter aestuarii]PSG88024.1 lycopene cyclase [Aurantibacter aestuarii]
MSAKHFDYIIIGNGLAGLQLALAFAEDSFFHDKKVALIDPDKKQVNDKTWSFWEKTPTKFNHLVYKSWQKALFYGNQSKKELNLTPYTYKSIQSIDFYTHAFNVLKTKSNFQFILDEVISVDSNIISVNTKNETYTASHVFDSRIPDDFFNDNNKAISIVQHFKGWTIKTDEAIFNPEAITMMDFRLKDGNQTTFTYVLPFSETEALIEFTFFTKDLVEDAVYDSYLKRYISEQLNISNYTITEVEKGQIPMTNFPFEKYNTKNITKIGTAGSWVKGSTGYSFKHTEKKVSQILENLKSNQKPSKNLFISKYKFYDKVFLKVLSDSNEKGEWIFSQFYTKNGIQTMFSFLDEESSFTEDLKIMMSLFSWSFIKAFFKTL